MAASSFRLICGLTSALAVLASLVVLPAAAQGPGRPPKRVAPKLDAVLPQLNAIVQVRSGDGTHLAAVRVSQDHALAYVPGRGPVPVGYEVRMNNVWTRVSDFRVDTAPRLILVRLTKPAAKAPTPTAKPLSGSAGFIVGAAGRERDLDIQTVWLEPDGPVDLPAGAVVFDPDGSFLGLVTEREGQRAIMPAADVLAAAAALAKR